MKKLKLKLWQVENVVLMKVLQQDESTRGKGKLFEYGGLTLKSVNEPVISNGVVFLSGYEINKDNAIDFLEFGDQTKATEYIQKVLDLVHEYNKSLIGTVPTIDDEVKTFIAE